jgi:cellulose synthase/poly-beta-1,6-N-acetylglucosamine synthase-like glycosyltransferase
MTGMDAIGAAEAVALVLMAAGLIQYAIHLVQLASAGALLAARPPMADDSALWASIQEVAPPISILVPAYNEEASAVDSLRSLLALHYPSFEVILINDGSKDGTLSSVIEAFGLAPLDRAYDPVVPHETIRGIYGSPRWPNLVVVDKANGGKADALNAGISVARSPLFCAMDADSVLETDALLRATLPFVDDPERVVVVGGAIRVANGSTIRDGRVLDIRLPRQLLPLIQIVEYSRAFVIARVAWSGLNALSLVSGAFGVFDRETVLAVGGYRRDTVGEDLEIVVRIHRYMREQGRPYRIAFSPEPVCWTEAPSRLRDMQVQRVRWQRGALETYFNHARLTFNPRYGRLGMLAMPHILIVDVLGPLIEVAGYILLPLLWLAGLIHVGFFVAFLALTILLGLVISIGALFLEEFRLRRYSSASALLKLCGVAILENVGYRQLANFWRIIGWYRYLRRKGGGWGHIRRTGFGAK